MKISFHVKTYTNQSRILLHDCQVTNDHIFRSYHLTITTKGLQFLFLWENFYQHDIFGFSRWWSTVSSTFSHSFCWCGKSAFDMFIRLFLTLEKMCEYNQIQFDMLCPVYWQYWLEFSGFYTIRSVSTIIISSIRPTVI